MRSELCKLNIYGPGGFFKAHVDTPRGADMFGSLVVLYPTPHEGGALVLRHMGDEWTLDCAKHETKATEGSIAYAAFFSDVEDEVLPVKSGYRVALTYNLYFDESSGNNTIRSLPMEDPFRRVFRTLLDDAIFLLNGAPQPAVLLGKDLKALAETCDVATFGMNSVDILDETYRKAGKLDSSHFASKFNVHELGLTAILRDSLMEDKSSERLSCELYKLNLYGPGGFFRAQVDTPRAANMFGSLVVIFPTVHEGGALALHHKGQE
ncbi:hypothetical protein CERSUDRAFT_91991 [Gelatoporia subvermispora B]|uniref:Fe2OG dioxygenase domain-containing protein n=1 Tax=Ceriporiopsis subvermispora (strain B) TaxID=914234 RepID=M2PS75_CERS8|nr:hypothetical protein CERSUDRAFT_91991 [Gelatoporia subvermispora B]